MTVCVAQWSGSCLPAHEVVMVQVYIFSKKIKSKSTQTPDMNSLRISYVAPPPPLISPHFIVISNHDKISILGHFISYPFPPLPSRHKKVKGGDISLSLKEQGINWNGLLQFMVFLVNKAHNSGL